MDQVYVNAFINAIKDILPQIGVIDVQRQGITLNHDVIKVDGVLISLGYIGDVKGNISYSFSEECAITIASKMMGAKKDEFDEIAKSAVSEMANMISGRACAFLSESKLTSNISIPTMTNGKNLEFQVGQKKILSVEFNVEGHQFFLHLSF